MANTQSSVSGPASSMTPRYPHLLNLSQRQFDNMFRPKRPRRATAWIADEIIEHNRIDQPGGLPKLPKELIFTITENLRWTDNVALALTCKELAEKTQSARRHFARVEEKKKSARDAIRSALATCHSRTATTRTLRTRSRIARDANKSLAAWTKYVRLDLLRQISDYFPAQRYRLCYGCIKYVPNTLGTHAWGGDVLYEKYNSKRANVWGPRCHRCVEREREHEIASMARDEGST